MFLLERIGKERRVKERMGVLRARAEPPPPESGRILKKFKAWIDTNAPNVGKLKERFTEAQFERIKQDFPIEVIENTLRSMHNYRELLKKYVSANLDSPKMGKKGYG